MAPYWQPDGYYNHGDVVEFEGVEYKIIQPHHSQGDLTPPMTPAFWERLRSGGRRHNREEKPGRDPKPLGPPDYGKQQRQRPVQHATEVDELSQLGHRSRSESLLNRSDDQLGGAPEEKLLCPSDHGQKERIEAEEVLQRSYDDHEEQWGQDSKPQRPLDCMQMERAKIEEASQRPRYDPEEQWGRDFKPRRPLDCTRMQRPEIEQVSQTPRHDTEEQWGEDFKPHNPRGHEQKEQQTLRIDSEYEAVTFPELDTVRQQQEKRGKRWFDTDDRRKIGGGILAGVAALGAGYMAYNHFRDNTEKKAARSWSINAWIVDSQTRTQQWRAGRYSAPVAWIWNEGRSIPRDAIQGGEQRGEVIYICRVYHQGGVMVGKASSIFKKGAVVGYKKDEIHYDKYEILVGDPRAVKWVTCSGQFNVGALHGARPIEGGREPDGSPIYIAQAPYRGAVYPGKACEVYGDGCFVPYDDTEKKIKEYAVLCYA